MFEHLP